MRRVFGFVVAQFVLQRGDFLTWIPAFQAVGILIYFSLSNEPETPLVAFLIVVGFILLLVALLNVRLLLILVAVFVIVGFISAWLRTTLLFPKDPVLRRQMYVKDVVGVLKEVDHRPGYTQLLVCKLEGVPAGCVRLSARTVVDSNIEIGDEITFSGVLYPPFMASSKNGYDFARVAYFKKIDALGFTTSKVRLYARNEEINFWEWVERGRVRIYERLSRDLNGDCAEIMAALLIGKRLGIKKGILKDVRDAGLSHLFAISGLHLSFVAGMCCVFFRYLFACSETLTLSYNTKKIASGMAISAGFLYLLFSGMSVSACRAFIMVALTFLGSIVDRRYDSTRSISLAASGILSVTPEALLLPSFQMSFAAVIALIASCSMVDRVMHGSIQKYLLITATGSFIASMATAPYAVFHFNYFSIVGVLANVVAVPLTTFIIIPLGVIYLLLDVMSMGFLVSHLLELSVDLILYTAKYAAQVKWSVLTFDSIPPSSVVAFTFGLLMLCWWRGSLKVCGGLFFILLGVLYAIMNRTPDILCSATGVVVKETDNKLYFATKIGSSRGYVYSAWARENGQVDIMKQERFTGLQRNLICLDGGCIYSGRVLISNNKDFILQHCQAADLVVQNSTDAYPMECNNVRYISRNEIKKHGAHYVWVNGSEFKVERARTKRPWHHNATGFAYRSSKSKNRKSTL